MVWYCTGISVCSYDARADIQLFTELGFVMVAIGGHFVPLDVVHEPVEDLHVTVHRDVHLLPALGVNREVLGKVTHLVDQKVTGTHEVLLQVLSLVTHVDHHIGPAWGERYRQADRQADTHRDTERNNS